MSTMASAYFLIRMLKRKRTQNSKRNSNEKSVKNMKISTEAFITDKKCRICLKEGFIPIFGNEDYLDISEDVKTFGDIILSEDDEHPKYICKVCHSHLQTAILFRKTAKESELVLNESLEKSQFSEDMNMDCSDDNHHSEMETYSCKLCELNFNSIHELTTHKHSRQHKNVRIQCTICHGLFTVQLYQRHLARHQSASHLICEVCGKMYRKDNLIRHLQLHSFELPYQCQVCPYRGRFAESLKIHMRTHSGDKPFSCNSCDLRFLTRSNLNRHLLTHKKERPFKCAECNRGFYTKRDLDVHFKSDHVGIKDFGCQMCGNKYGTRKALMRHELRVHKRDKMSKGRLPLYLQAEYIKNCESTILKS